MINFKEYWEKQIQDILNNLSSFIKKWHQEDFIIVKDEDYYIITATCVKTHKLFWKEKMSINLNWKNEIILNNANLMSYLENNILNNIQYLKPKGKFKNLFEDLAGWKEEYSCNLFCIKIKWEETFSFGIYKNIIEDWYKFFFWNEKIENQTKEDIIKLIKNI